MVQFPMKCVDFLCYFQWKIWLWLSAIKDMEWTWTQIGLRESESETEQRKEVVIKKEIHLSRYTKSQKGKKNTNRKKNRSSYRLCTTFFLRSFCLSFLLSFPQPFCAYLAKITYFTCWLSAIAFNGPISKNILIRVEYLLSVCFHKWRVVQQLDGT